MEISPNEVVFTPPFEEVRSTQLHLQNTTNHTLIYKVKTTTPQLYSVRPNAASVEAGKTLSVEITRQGRPYSESEGRDKFLILSTVLDPELAKDPEVSIAQIWTQLESSGSNAKIDARKLRVVTHNSHGSSEDHSSPANVAGGAAAGTATAGTAGHSSSAGVPTPNSKESTEPKTISDELKSTGFTPSPSTGANHNLPVQPSGEHHTGGHEHHQTGSEHPSQKGHESSKSSSSQSTKSATSSSLPAQGSGPHGEVTVDDLQGTPGVPPKSKLVDEGDALTGPKLANSKLPDGPKPSHGLDDKKNEQAHEPSTDGKVPGREVPGAIAVGKRPEEDKQADAPKPAAGSTEKSLASESTSTSGNDKKAESSAQAAAGSKGSQTDYLESAGEYAQQAREQAGEYAEAAKENLQSAGTTAVNATAAAAGAAAGYVSGATTNVANWLHSKDANADDPNATAYLDSETSFHDNSKSLGGLDRSVNSGGFKAASANSGAEKNIAGGPKTSGSDSQPGPSADVHYGVVNLGEAPKPSTASHDHQGAHHHDSHHHGSHHGAAGAAAGAVTGAGVSDLSSKDSSTNHHLHNQAQDYKNQAKSSVDSGVKTAESHAESLNQSAQHHIGEAKHSANSQIPSDVKRSLAHGDAQGAIHSADSPSNTGRATIKESYNGFDKTINGPAANVGGAYTKQEPESRLLQNPQDTLAFHGNSTTTSAGSSTTTAQSEGVQQIDVTTAAILALVAFLIGWKFF